MIHKSNNDSFRTVFPSLIWGPVITFKLKLDKLTCFDVDNSSSFFFKFSETTFEWTLYF